MGPSPHLGERGPAVRPGPRPGLNPDLRAPVRQRASVQEEAEVRGWQRRCWWLAWLAPVAALNLLLTEVGVLVASLQVVMWWRAAS